MNQFLIERICQKLIPFPSPVKKIKSKSFRVAAERTGVSICVKTKSAEINRYILGALMSFSVQSGKVINYEKALASPLSPIPLNKASADRSLQKKKRVN